MTRLPIATCALLSALSVAACSSDPYGDQPTGTAAIWVVNQVSDIPTIDFCVRGQAQWLGPVMQVLQNQPNGLAKGQTTGPLPLSAATYTARLVDPKTAYCLPALNGKDFSITVEAGKNYTATVTGSIDPGPVELQLTPR